MHNTSHATFLGVALTFMVSVLLVSSSQDGSMYRYTEMPKVVAGSTLTADSVELLEPIRGQGEIPIEPGAQTFINYFEAIGEYIYYVAVGICVLWILLGSYKIMLTGGDAGKRGEGKEMITTAIIGIAIVTFAGFLLRSLNNIFFV